VFQILCLLEKNPWQDTWCKRLLKVREERSWLGRSRVERQPSKCEALSSNPKTPKKKGNTEGRVVGPRESLLAENMFLLFTIK
jgi:hypothetical protein